MGLPRRGIGWAFGYGMTRAVGVSCIETDSPTAPGGEARRCSDMTLGAGWMMSGRGMLNHADIVLSLRESGRLSARWLAYRERWIGRKWARIGNGMRLWLANGWKHGCR